MSCVHLVEALVVFVQGPTTVDPCCGLTAVRWQLCVVLSWGPHSASTLHQNLTCAHLCCAVLSCVFLRTKTQVCLCSRSCVIRQSHSCYVLLFTLSKLCDSTVALLLCSFLHKFLHKCFVFFNRDQWQCCHDQTQCVLEVLIAAEYAPS